MRRREPCCYRSAAALAWWVCVFDLVATVITFFLNTGQPVFSDWYHLWDSQLVHYKYHTSVADVLLLSLFRASPGLVFYRRLSRRVVGSKVQRTRWAGFMLFKTTLSSLAIWGKASAFKAWSSKPVEACLLIALLCSTLEAVLTGMVLAGVRKEAAEEQQRHKDEGGHDRPLLDSTEDEEAGEAGGGAQEGQEGGAAAGKKKGASVGRLLQLAKPERGLIFWGTVALFLSSLSFMVLPYFIGKLIDEVNGQSQGESAHKARQSLNESTWVLLVILLAGSVFTFIRGTLFNMAGERLVARIRRDLFERIATQDIGFFDTQKTGELMNRLSSDTTVIQNACTSNVSMFLRFGLQVILSTVLLFVTSWQLSLVMFAVVPALILATRLYSGFIRKFSKQYQDALASSSEVAQETLSNVRTVRSFAAERHEVSRYWSRVDESYRLGVLKAVAYGFFMGGIGAVSYAAMLLVLWYGGTQVIEGSLSPGTLTSFLLYTVYIATGLSVLSGLVSEWMQAVGASERMFELLDRRPSIPLHGGCQVTSSLEGKIRFESVCFHYPSREDVTVLRDFSLTIEPNATVALVGPSGSGKSTVLALLQRFYDVSDGRILVDGRDLRDYDITSLRQHIATVSQEPVLFACSIRENISYGLTAHGKPEPSLEEVVQVATLANAHEFISKFPEGYDTVVGERGVRLSGGQKQRVAIARALLVDPRILLLDEATSALDAESEHLVQDAIDRLMVGRSTIVIAHRLSTVRNASTIAVVSDGELKDVGKHEELLCTSDIYRQLIKRQLQPDSGRKAEAEERDTKPAQGGGEKRAE